ncbi:Uma2 family endonuclease [Nitratifractor sp.]
MAALDYVERYTIEDYRQWEGDWELIHGVAYAMAPSPPVTHQSVMARISHVLLSKSDECEKCLTLVETDYEISEDTVVRPDVLLICKEIDERVDRAPEIIFEVLSPSTARRDETIKLDLYRQEGVRYTVLVHPGRRVAKVYRLTEDGRYVKTGDFSDETFTFTLEECSIGFDFSTIWRR